MRNRLRTIRSIALARGLPRGTGAHRWQGILRTAGAGMVAKAVSLGGQLLLVPILLGHLGTEGFGLWATVTSIFLFLGLGDLGLGFGLQNRIGRATGQDAWVQIPGLIATGAGVLLTISILIGVVGSAILATDIPTHWVSLPDPALAHDFQTSLWLTLAAFCLGLPLSVANRLAHGLQQGWWAAMGQALAVCLTLLGAIAGTLLGFRLPFFVALSVFLPAAMNGLILLIVHRRERWTLQSYHPLPDEAGQMFRHGLLFFLTNLGNLAFNHYPVIVLTSLLGPAAAVPYAVAQRLFSLATQIHSVFLGPFWPAFAEAASRGDGLWIAKTFRRMTWATIAYSGVMAPAWIILAPAAIVAWTNRPDVVPTALFLGLQLVFGLAGIFGTTFSTFLNGLSLLRSQALATAIGAIASLVLLPAGIRQFGLEGAIGTVAFFYTVVTFGVLLPRCLRALDVFHQDGSTNSSPV